MTRTEALAFADWWIATWNRRDVEGILNHFSDDARFTSPKAVERVGSATVHGKAAMRAYWQASVALIHSLTFTLDRVLWDADSSELLIVYRSEINGQRNRACELFRLNAAGNAVEGEAMYGAAL